MLVKHHPTGKQFELLSKFEEVPFIKYFRIYEKSLKTPTLLLFRFCVNKNVIKQT
jgi:hypothetical protein